MGGDNVVEEIAVAAAEVAAGVAALPLVALQNIATLGLLVFTALGLVGSRALLLQLSPSIAKHAKGFATVLNVAIDALQVVAIAVHEVIAIIMDAVRALLGKHTHKLTKPHFIKDPVSSEDIRRVFSDLPARQDAAAPRVWLHLPCRRRRLISTRSPARPPPPQVQTVRLGAVHPGGGAKYVLANQTCPVVRATYPVPWMWRASNALLGWTTNDADPRGGNCQIAVQDDWLCAALGSGFVIAEASRRRRRTATAAAAAALPRSRQRQRQRRPRSRTPPLRAAQVLLPIFIVFLVWPYVLKPVAKLGLELAAKAVEWGGELVELFAGRIHAWFETR